MLAGAGLAGLPQLTLPLGEVEGLPFGISLIGGRFSDEALLEAGARILAACTH